ncbi:glucan biosynthesis protein [Beijerinckia indica]|uniref:Periplasmic glucan biosynthesis protein MdoG n=1 Tax=Beijerinckia indica subsp. indica (strain ATCC 9039 / DSM 1715 / NCIMB 8712) TaxID=395963 RepID=B2IIN1_BEII9|nr:glucan biosynthesis protein G [Beijerinckia indica]ACB94724.1 periplasmic glucan biosynthesis protein MdoG [Beijerinckia indica subsp. indica ATCC 9039]
MADFPRRHFVQGLFASTALLSCATSGHAAPANPSGNSAANNAATPAPAPKFDFDDVVRRARDLAAAPFDARPPVLPDALAQLDFDTWRDIKTRSDKAFVLSPQSPFRMQLFHLGHLYKRPVIVNTIRDGIPTPIPYAANLFDYGRAKFDKPLPVNLGFAGFRLHYPLNSPKSSDEIISFIGASYFRFVGRGESWGLSARGLAVDNGSTNEEFPFFREFWIEASQQQGDRAIIYALLDSSAATGAYRFELSPGKQTELDVSATLFSRKTGVKLGLAPLTSMFLAGENEHRFKDDFRFELHDSDGLLIHSNTDEWIWRPLRNPPTPQITTFPARDFRGFGLLQRDRAFDHYQDLELAYQSRPSYWVEPHENWGDGHVDLLELPTADETNDNIVASFVPSESFEPGKALSFGYRITSFLDAAKFSPNGRVINTFQTVAKALGSSEPVVPNSRRFLIDFAGGDLAYYLDDPSLIEIVSATNNGQILRTFLMPDPYIKGFRAAIDVALPPGQTADLRLFLRSGQRVLTETWVYSWLPQ